MTELFDCFGIEYLGKCAYNPDAPTMTYFTVGDAIAALAFTFAVQQLVKPIYLFRLSVRGVRLSYIMWAVLFGACLPIFSVFVPSIGVFEGSPLGYPVTWEILGGLIIFVAYALIAVIVVRPALVTRRNVSRFTSAGSYLLSGASEDDRVAFASDILKWPNLERLVEMASEFDRAEAHATAIAWEKLQENGRTQEGLRGRQESTAFYDFARRDYLARATQAWHFLQLISDRDFARAVLRRYPWNFVNAACDVSKLNCSAKPLQSFVQAVAWEALVDEGGMLAREDNYQGFGVQQSFAHQFFGKYDCCGAYDPLNGIGQTRPSPTSVGFVSRLNLVAELMVRGEIKARGFWEPTLISGIGRIYESIAHELSYDRSKKVEAAYMYELQSGISAIIQAFESELQKAELRTYNLLFRTQEQAYDYQSIRFIANSIAEAVFSVSNGFGGIHDSAWFFAHEIFDKVYPRFGTYPAGMSPLQQHVTLEIIEKLKENLNGYYPTVSRVLLAVIGPHKELPIAKVRTAFVILKDAVYGELKRLPDLYIRDRKKAEDLLPPNVKYDHKRRTLIHTYSNGEKAYTKLSTLRIAKVNLFSPENFGGRVEANAN